MQCEYCGITDEETRIINSEKYGILCRKHYLQKYRHGMVFKTIYEPNDIVNHENYSEIILRANDGNITGYAKIDNEDIDKVAQYKWHIKNSLHTQYAIAHVDENKKIFLHRLILGYDGKLDIDHINHDGLDNRKCNLRIIDHSLNIMNQYGESNGIKLVPSGNYQATIMVDGKSIYLGTFPNFQEAKEARINYKTNLFS